MKHLVFALMLLSVSTSHSVAEDTPKRVGTSRQAYAAFEAERFEHHYLTSLEYSNSAIVESALREIVLIRLAQPSLQYPKVKRKIEQLITSGATPQVRYKAYLVNQVFEQPLLFQDLSWTALSDTETTFFVLGGVLQSAFAAH